MNAKQVHNTHTHTHTHAHMHVTPHHNDVSVTFVSLEIFRLAKFRTPSTQTERERFALTLSVSAVL